MISAIAASVMAIAAVVGVAFGLIQLSNIRTELRNGSLDSILEIESQMNERKSKVDEITNKIMVEGSTWTVDLKSAYSLWLNQAKENWYNAIDRFAFCVIRNYVEENEWKVEYRNYIHDVIIADPTKFQTGSPYRNMIDLDNKWQRN